MTKRDGICNIRNFALDMVATNPTTEKERRFMDLFIKINDRYADCRYEYPSDSFIQELYNQLNNKNAFQWLMFEKHFNLFNSAWYALRECQEKNDFEGFLDSLLRYGFGISPLPKPVI